MIRCINIAVVRSVWKSVPPVKSIIMIFLVISVVVLDSLLSSKALHLLHVSVFQLLQSLLVILSNLGK